MSTFRKRPVEIEAVRWIGGSKGVSNGGYPPTATKEEAEAIGYREKLELPDWLPMVKHLRGSAVDVPVGAIYYDGKHLNIGTLEGTMRASVGDWIIKGVKGELYSCRDDVFRATYDIVMDCDICVRKDGDPGIRWCAVSYCPMKRKAA